MGEANLARENQPVPEPIAPDISEMEIDRR